MESTILIRKWIPLPANDVLDRVRPLSPDDIGIIIHDHGPAFGAAIDRNQPSTDVLSLGTAAYSILSEMVELQRDIVWRGSWLKRAEVEKLKSPLGLYVACLQVMMVTQQEYTRASLVEAVYDHLAPFSRYFEV